MTHLWRKTIAAWFVGGVLTFFSAIGLTYVGVNPYVGWFCLWGLWNITWAGYVAAHHTEEQRPE